ncbi:MAG: glycosyltransferase family 4 protein [Phycisphaerae bacterium]
MNPDKNILFINEFYHPDIVASATVLADRLPRLARLREDWRITVLTGNRAWNEPTRIHPPVNTHKGVRIVRVRRPSVSGRSLARRILGFAAFEHRAVRAARRLGRIDLVVATTAPPRGARIARKIARAHGCPYVYTVLDLYPDLVATLGRLSSSSLIYRYWRSGDTRAMRDAAAVVTISQGIADRIARTRDIEAAELLTIYDGFDPARVEIDGDLNTFQQASNPQGRFVVQYAGNMGLSHPFETIMEACRLLADREDILFQFIGDGPGRAYVRDRLPPNGRIWDYQPAEHLGPLLATADVCLISQHEAMYDQALPYKIYAILAAGRPAIFIGNERSEVAEWLKTHQAGLHVDQGCPADLADAIRTLRSDPEQAASMGQAARAFFDDRLDAQRSAEQWAELIDRLLGTKTAVPPHRPDD